VTVVRWACLDVGETLIDETRIWSTWADELGVSRLALMAALGGAIARGGDHQEVFGLVGVHDWAVAEAAVQRAYGQFTPADLYPDALPTLDALRGAGFRVAIMGNQPASREAELRALGVEAEVMAMSDQMGVGKPDPAFFTAALRLMGDPDPHTVAYVGDRVDNDVVPAAEAGLRAVWLRRGPWGLLQSDEGDRAALVLDQLADLPARLSALADP
jgi:HAD superfamily hydrolase (TIGR01549 family)